MRLFLIFIFIANTLCAQRDSAIGVVLFGANFGGHLPSGDLVKRFGPNLKAGGSLLYKSKGNWIFGIESNFMFGKKVKEDVLKQLKNSEGFVTDNEGYPADLRVTERALTLHLVAGKIVKVFNSNPNSGLMFTLGVGLMQHKINLFDAQQRIAAISGNLRNGYDRLTAGPCLSQFIGYMYLSPNRIVNFYFGIESFQASTKSLRKVNYDTGQPDLQQRLDILTGIRAGWILPLYKKKPNDVYYN